jgi:hypothetical protein
MVPVLSSVLELSGREYTFRPVYSRSIEHTDTCEEQDSSPGRAVDTQPGLPVRPVREVSNPGVEPSHC